MRDFKFRAWVATDWGENGRPCKYKMVEWSNDFFSDSSIVTGYSDEFPTEPDCYLMQYTGLKDVNGKEIYEGDIVRYRDGVSHWDGGYTKPTEVKYEYGSFFPFCGCGGEYSMDVDDAVIIGNVHEHPELLEGSQC